MAPRKAAEQKSMANNRPTSNADAFDPPQSQLSQESQDKVTKEVEEAINNSKQQARKRRKERQDAVFKATNARCNEIRGLIDEAYSRYEDKLESIRHTKLERLEQLLQQREELEQSLEDDEAAMEKLYMTMAEKLQIALDNRLEILA
ncbi:hypothetical protein KC332_g5343 [Hortaea werneckii]|uniref:Uncharacterized protein n=2 Tax=Hortaea werneckii TaxID=91943 RepID=A0A3M7HMG0_HORWE|nr:hypothetical protein KC358_g7054 [Hortaea werneckii]OTA35659.1 hypothetical protein BTJ68_04960 [Hortaea werneckii EXF-2000]KAI6845524.1 hypothetical protein KC350_g4403 [Hortaea werneckii]KAI6902476.1 hypothetical protein KC348_g16078 [Hortaea werneckii]KAI6921397.1 hypothetical protein KC341_g15954 [Hortaea werneckii]